MKYRIVKRGGWWYVANPSGFFIYANRSWRTAVDLLEDHLQKGQP